MRVVVPGDEITVAVGEIFGIARPEHGASGYRTDVTVPAGIAHIGTDRTAPGGFADPPRVVERLRCERIGTYVVTITHQRPWGGPAITSSARVRAV